MSKSIKFITAVIMLVAILLGAASCSAGGKAVDLQDFATVQFSSFDKHGKADLTVDYNAIMQKLDTKKAQKYFKKVCPEDAELYRQFGDDANLTTYLTIEFAQDYKNLANGDKVVVTAKPSDKMVSANQTLEDIEKGLGIKIKNAEFKVEGLETAKEVNIIKDINEWCVFSGTNGNGKLEIKGEKNAKFQDGDFYFSTNNYNTNNIVVVHKNTKLGVIGLGVKDSYGNFKSGKNNITKGEVITVYLYGGVLSEMEKLGYVPAQTEFEITVPDLGNYVTSKNELTSEDINQMRTELQTLASEKLNNCKIVSDFFIMINPGAACDEDQKIKYICCVEYNKTSGFGQGKKYYWASAYGIIKNDSGVLRFDTDIGNYGYSSENALLSSLNSDYTIEK